MTVGCARILTSSVRWGLPKRPDIIPMSQKKTRGKSNSLFQDFPVPWGVKQVGFLSSSVSYTVRGVVLACIHPQQAEPLGPSSQWSLDLCCPLLSSCKLLIGPILLQRVRYEMREGMSVPPEQMTSVSKLLNESLLKTSTTGFNMTESYTCIHFLFCYYCYISLQIIFILFHSIWYIFNLILRNFILNSF